MPFRTRPWLLVASGALLFLGVFAFVSAPLAVSTGVRLWLAWKARQYHFSIGVERVDAPFLRPVVIHGLRITAAPSREGRSEFAAARISVGLNLRAILFRASDRAIRRVSIDGLQVEIRPASTSAPSLNQSAFTTLQNLLPGSFNCQHVNLRIETRRAVVLLRNLFLSGNEIEAGRVGADQLMIVSPWFRQSFSQLRGATKWEENRLTLAGLSLTRRFDLPAVTTDLSHLAQRGIGFDFDVELFGGKIRADISREQQGDTTNWNVLGSAADISLAQTADALGFAGRIGGLLHACKFSFRGNPLDLQKATGWLWTEVTAPTWQQRAADVLMLGATLYDRQIGVHQFYLKQGDNELTISGEAAVPASWAEWTGTNFRSDVSGAIADLDAFATLFGAKSAEFAGWLQVEGTVEARARKLDGRVTANGSGLALFKCPIDLLTAKVNLKATQIEFEELELARGMDSLRLAGKIDIREWQNSRATLVLSLGNLADYLETAPLASLRGQVALGGRLAEIESLQLQDGPLGIEFGGTIDLGEMPDIAIVIRPNRLLFDFGWLDAKDCARAVQWVAAAQMDMSRPQIETIDLRGNLFRKNWRIALTTDVGPAREWRLCRNSEAHSLHIAVFDSPAIDFGQSALRSFRHGQNRGFSLSSDLP